MLRRMLVLAFLALAVLGVRSAAFEEAVIADAHDVGEAGCCPCEEDGTADDGCCASAQCACFPTAAIATAERDSSVDADPVPGTPTAWTLGAEQRARDRSTAPPTRPPIG
jgi:hypothetical protein